MPFEASVPAGVSLITGASRGIGAATAVRLASRGWDAVLNYRNKSGRAEAVAREIAELGRVGMALQADLTVEREVSAMMEAIGERFGRLDLLILNASGGLEKGKASDYAMELNVTAQLRTARMAADLMGAGGRMIFVTSHWAHFYGEKPVHATYEAVARSKHAGEAALRAYAAERGIPLGVVSGDAIEGTITPRLLERGGLTMGTSGERRLPTVDEFAEAIVRVALDGSLPDGHTEFVGSTES